MEKIAALSSLPLGWRQVTESERLNTGLPEVDTALGGFPRGRVSEIVGSPSSGRTTLLNSLLAAATSGGEHCVLVDTRGAFDPPSAAARGVVLEKLFWIRCGGNVESSLRSADLLLHNGGFGVVALDLGDVPVAMLHRIPSTSWFRFRRAVESTPTLFVVVSNRPVAGTCASLLVETRRRKVRFLRSADFEIIARKPIGKEPGAFHVRLHSLAAG